MATPIVTTRSPFDSFAKSDAILRSSDKVDFYVLKTFLSYPSPVFESTFSPSQSNDSPTGKNAAGQCLTIFPMKQESKILQAFLPFFYPSLMPRIEDMDDTDIINVMVASNAYDAGFIVEYISEKLVDLPIMKKDPVQMFALAIHHGWEKIGRAAAERSLEVPISELKISSELARISGADAFRLLEYRFQCINGIRQCLRKERWRKRHHGKRLPIWESEEKCSVHQCRPGSLCVPDYVMVDHDGLGPDSAKGLQWWAIYIGELRREIEARPHACTVLDDRLSNIAIQRATQCSNCSQYVHEDLANFKRFLADDIKEVIQNICQILGPPSRRIFRF